MKKYQNILRWFLPALLLSVLLVSHANAAGWWNIKWPYRIRVKLDPKGLKRQGKHKLPGQNVAVVKFRTSNLIEKTGTDIRVVTSSGREVPYRILQIGPGDLLSLTFAIRPGATLYHIYFGNPKASASREKNKTDALAKAKSAEAALIVAKKKAIATAKIKADTVAKLKSATTTAHKAKIKLDAADKALESAKAKLVNVADPTTRPAYQAAEKPASAAKLEYEKAKKQLAKTQANANSASQADKAAQRDLTKKQAARNRTNSLVKTTQDISKPLEIKRGVLLEVWHYNNGPANNISQAKQALTNAQKKTIIGRGFRDRIFAGHNPFGPQNKIVARYTAYALAEKSGEYLFACSSNNASFLLINDRLIVDNGRWHGPQRDIRKSGKISLKKGIYKLTFLHINPWGWPMVAVVYRIPGNKKVSLIPPGAYTEIINASPGPIQRYGQSGGIDFIVIEGGEVFMKNRYFQRRVFSARKTGSPLNKKNWMWDFGDGQKLIGLGENIQHVYLKPGTYKITLQNKARPNLKRTHHVLIDRNWDKVTLNKLDSLKDYAKIVADYDFKALNPKSNVEAALLFQRAGDFKSLHKACEAFVRRTTAGDAEIRTLLPIYIQALLPINQTTRGVTALKHAATMTRNPTVQAETLVRAGQLQLDPLEQPDEAMKTFEDVLTRLSKSAKAPIIRDAQIGLGDVWRARGDTEQALGAYIEAGVTDKRAKSFRAIAKGDFARQAEDYVRRKNYLAAKEILDKWERTLPTDRLEGFSTMLRCKLLLGRKEYASAARAAETLVKVNPESNYAPELLMQAAEAYGYLNEINKANRSLARIIKSYRESPLFYKAIEKLRKNRAREKNSTPKATPKSAN